MTSRSRPVALVTGGGIRLGRAMALGLAADGYDLVIGCNRSRQAADQVVDAAAELGSRARAVGADLSREEGAVRLARAAREAFGRLDLLVNSASSFVPNDLLGVSAAEWDGVMALNVRAPFLLVRETAALLRAARGAVVNVVDLSALRPWTSHPHHSVSKAALLHLTRVMARRLAPEVRVNAVAPGDVLPPDHYGAEEVERLRRQAPMGRLPGPDDVVAALRFLARAAYVTGEVVVVDGGAGLAACPSTSASQRSASSAAMHPVPAAETAWR